MMKIAKRSKTLPIIATRSELARALSTAEGQIEEITSDASRHYGYLELPKPNGGVRKIYPPRRALREIQRTLLDLLYRRIRIPGYLHGGLPKRSIITHARTHLGQEMVATLDIKGFFPSTKPAMIEPLLGEVGFAEQALSDVIALSTLNDELPQGSPTSCLLANLACLGVDQRIRKICGRRGLAYSRYVDDIAVSGRGNFSELRGPFKECVEQGHYSLAPGKTHFWTSAQRQVVTGLVVNEKLRPTKKFITELRHDIRTCLEQGACAVARADGIRVRQLKQRLKGRIAHYMQCDPVQGKKFRRQLFGID